MHIWSLSLPFWPLSLPFCSPPAVWQAGREHPKITTPYKSDTYKISVFSTCIRNDRWRTPPAKKAAKPRRQKAQKSRSRTGQRRALESKEPPGAVRTKALKPRRHKGTETPEPKGTKRQSPQTCHTKVHRTQTKKDRPERSVPIRNMS